MRRTTPLLLLVLAACEGASNPGVRIEMIDPGGENAAREIREGLLAVRVRQGDRSLCDAGCSTEIVGGSFELALPIESLVELTFIQAEMTGGDADTIGAVPGFAVAGEFLETATVPVRVVMQPPGTCAPLDLFNVSSSGIPRLVEPRRDMAIAVRRNLVLLAGGRGEAGGSNRADFFDQVVVEMRLPLESPSGPLGPSRGLALSEDQSLVVGETAWIYDRPPQGPASPVPLPGTLHAGAGFASALALVNNSAAVIGGEASSQVTWFTANTFFGTYDLSETREFPSAAAGREGVLVVGGGPGAEWITANGESVPASGTIADSTGGWIAVSPSRQTFLAIGGSGSETTIFRGCPACVGEPGPTWTRARAGASAAPTAAGALWIVGGDDSALIDRVVWRDEGGREVPEMIEETFTLTTPRDGAAVVEHASGVVTIIGGENTVSGMLDTVEVCTPPGALDPLF